MSNVTITSVADVIRVRACAVRTNLGTVISPPKHTRLIRGVVTSRAAGHRLGT